MGGKEVESLFFMTERRTGFDSFWGTGADDYHATMGGHGLEFILRGVCDSSWEEKSDTLFCASLPFWD